MVDIKVGESYRTHNGKRATVLCYLEEEYYCWKGIVLDSDGIEKDSCWTKSGLWYRERNDPGDWPLDLVREWTDE